MLDIKELQVSLHKHSISATNALQLIKMRLQAELESKVKPNAREEYLIKADIRRTEAIIEQILCFELMDEFYQTNYGVFKGKI